MSLSNPNSIVTEQRLSEFYQSIYPYLGSGGESHVVYGFHISNSESVPSSKVTYLADAIGMTPAHMDYANDVFDYGSWADAFFMPKPCMLKYDGTVDYYLDPNDYTKKLDGTASDVANTSYAGNAMMEWGQNGKKIWLKIVPKGSKGNREVDVYIADRQVDPNFTDWNFHNSSGQSVDHFYTSIYNSSLIDNKFRSISGQQAIGGKTAQQELDYAMANNPTGSLIWTTETITDMDLINILLILISKSTNCQGSFGKGIITDDSSDPITNFRTGVHNTKGLFYGTSSGASATHANAVKVFGMENWWGFQFRRVIGEFTNKGSRKRKLTYGTEDGSTVTGYNFTGNGYVDSNIVTKLSSFNGGYISEVVFTDQGIFPVAASGGSDSTYYCDGIWCNINNASGVPVYGGTFAYGETSGILCCVPSLAPTAASKDISSTISARPLS